MRRESLNFYGMLDNGLDMTVNMAAFCLGYALIEWVGVRAVIPLLSGATLLTLFFGVILSSFVYQLFRLYAPSPYFSARSVIAPVIRANITFFGLLILMTALFSEGEKRRFVIIWCVTAGVVSTVVMVLKKRVSSIAFRLIRKRLKLCKRIIVVGNDVNAAASFVKQINKDDFEQIRIDGTVGEKLKDAGCEWLGGLSALREIISERKPDAAVFAMDLSDRDQVLRMVNLCDDKCVKVFFLPAAYGFIKSHRQLERIGDISVINLHTTPLDNPLKAFVKRGVDLSGAVILLILTSPIMLFTAIGVKLSSKGPVLFRQERVGVGGRKFIMLKFRSMKVNDESGTAWSTGNDPRITRFGSFIRKTSIDELPQLFNVIFGDMSLVGPRPEIPYFVDRFRKSIPLYMIKHYVRPGITGLAQIRGLRGDTSIEERILADIDYIENWSLLLDLEIMIKTPFKIINKNERYTHKM